MWMSMTRKHALVLGTLAGLWLAASAAQAQALRPNILILLDTSGSMLYSQSLDGSPLCNDTMQHTTQGQTSRVYNMKNAIRAALAQVGTDEANFGLARFPQLENAATTNCPAAHWSNGPTATSAANCDASTTCMDVNPNTGTNNHLVGCKLTTHSLVTPQTAYGTWFDNGIGQAIMVP